MYRVAIEELYKWKEGKRRKPLIIEGARQVGKTWLMKEFGNRAYENTVYINFDSNSRMAELFASDLNTERLIMGLELYAGRKIDPTNTLLIFDEVQEVPRALSSLKYFYEDVPQYHIICAGSLLGIALHGGTSFPVGKVDFLTLYPLSFKEFLAATTGERFSELLDEQDYQLITPFKQTYIDALKQYYFVGGMPEAVESFIEEKDGQRVFLNGEDVSTEIRTKQITDIISEVSKIPQVREKLLELQRNLAVRTKYCNGRKRHRNCSISKCRCKNLFRCISRRKN